MEKLLCSPKPDRHFSTASAELTFLARALIHVNMLCYQPERNLWNPNLLYDFSVFICQN